VNNTDSFVRAFRIAVPFFLLSALLGAIAGESAPIIVIQVLLAVIAYGVLMAWVWRRWRKRRSWRA